RRNLTVRRKPAADRSYQNRRTSRIPFLAGPLGLTFDPKARSVTRGLRVPFLRRRSDDDFAREIQAHLELEAERLAADGLPADEARAAARRRFGNVTRACERFRE